jgi:hypothetical protein
LRCAPACSRWNLECTRFPSWLDDIVQDALVLVQEGKLANASFPPRWSDVVQDALVLVQEGKLACASFPPWWNDV